MAAWLYGIFLVFAVESWLAYVRPAWFVILCRWPLGIRYSVRVPVRARTEDVAYRSSARASVPWRDLPRLAIEGARIEPVLGGDTFLVTSTAWRSADLTRIDFVRRGDEIDLHARALLVPLSTILVPVWVVCLLGGVGEPRPWMIGFAASMMITLPVQLFRARSAAMEHARLAMERIGEAIRAPTSEDDHVPPPWTARARVALGFAAIPLGFLAVQHFDRPAEREGAHAGRGDLPITDPLALQPHVEVSARRGLALRERGLAYEPAVHTGLARLDDGTLLAHHAIEVQIAERSTAHCATLADGSILDLYYLTELAQLGEDTLHAWETQLDMAVALELEHTGASLPEDPDAIVEATWRDALVGLSERDAERRDLRLHADPGDDLETRCRSYLAQEEVISQLPLVARATFLRARHLIAAREIEAESP